MTEQAHKELLADVLSRYEQSPDPRLREISDAAVRHLHAFVEEVRLQRDEWFAGIQFLTATGKIDRAEIGARPLIGDFEHRPHRVSDHFVDLTRLRAPSVRRRRS